MQLMSVFENLQLGAYYRKGDISDSINKVFEKFPVLKEKKGSKSWNPQWRRTSNVGNRPCYDG